MNCDLQKTGVFVQLQFIVHQSMAHSTDVSGSLTLHISAMLHLASLVMCFLADIDFRFSYSITVKFVESI